MLPQTPKELEIAQKEAINIVICNQRKNRYFETGKFVWRYQCENIPDFIVVEYNANHHIKNDLKCFYKKAPDYSSTTFDEFIKKTFNKNIEREHFTYRLTNDLDIKTPEFKKINSNEKKLILEFIDGEDITSFFKKNQNLNLDDICPNRAILLAKMAIMGRSDIHNGNMLVKNNELIHFDFDGVFENIDESSDYIEKSQYDALTTLSLFKSFERIANFSGSSSIFQNLPSNVEMIDAFLETKDSLITIEHKYTHPNEVKIFNCMHARVDTSIQHLKAKI